VSNPRQIHSLIGTVSSLESVDKLVKTFHRSVFIFCGKGTWRFSFIDVVSEKEINNYDCVNSVSVLSHHVDMCDVRGFVWAKRGLWTGKVVKTALLRA
jgi:hypothetical protein